MKVLFGFVFLALSVFLVIFQMILLLNPPSYFIQHSKVFVICTLISLICAFLVYAGKETSRTAITIAGSVALLVCLCLLIFMIYNVVARSGQIIRYGYIVLLIYAVIFSYYGFTGVTGR